MAVLTEQDLRDIVHGSSVFACGGGGTVTEALEYVTKTLETKVPVKLLSLDQIPEESFLCAPFGLGGHSREESQRAFAPDPKTKPATASEPESALIVDAVNHLSKLCGKQIDGFVPVENGPVSLAIALYAAASSAAADKNGHRGEEGAALVVDGDPIGRSVPEASLTGFMLHGLPVAPVAVGNTRGERFDLLKLPDATRMETLLRVLAQESRGRVFGAAHAMSAREMRPAIHQQSVSRAMKVGRIMRDVCGKGGDVAAAVAEGGEGKVVFRGVVAQITRGEELEFTNGEVTLKGTGVFERKMFKFRFKNEILAGWMDDEIFVTVPEITCVFDEEEGIPIDNSSHHIGGKVAVVVLPAPPLYLTEKGLEVFGPSYAGLNVPFRSALGKDFSENEN